MTTMMIVSKFGEGTTEVLQSAQIEKYWKLKKKITKPESKTSHISQQLLSN